jgi:hypothetical protein
MNVNVSLKGLSQEMDLALITCMVSSRPKQGRGRSQFLAATEAAMADTTAVATAAMTPQANVAEATAGEVAAVGGSAVTPAEAATASTSHSLLTATQPHSSSPLVYIIYQFSF